MADKKETYLQKMQNYPKRNLVFGRNMPEQGNVSIEDMLNYLQNNYQDMERPTSPVPNDILKRYAPGLLQRNAEGVGRPRYNGQFRDDLNRDILMDVRDKYVRPPAPMPQEYSSGWGRAMDAPMQKVNTGDRAVTDYGTRENYYKQLLRNALMRSAMPLFNRLMQKYNVPITPEDQQVVVYPDRPHYDDPSTRHFRNFTPEL